MKDFLSILNHLFQAYIVLCISLLFKEKMDNLQVNRFVLKPVFFRLNGLHGKFSACHVIEKLLFCCVVM